MFAIETRGVWLVVHLHGELDLAVSDGLRATLFKAVNRSKRVVADFSEVTFLDSAGISVLVSAARQTDARGGRLVLVGLCDRLVEVLEITGVDRILDIRAGAFEQQDIGDEAFEPGSGAAPSMPVFGPTFSPRVAKSSTGVATRRHTGPR